MCVEVSLARNEPSVRSGQSLTKTIGIKVCGSFCHRISVTSFCHRISVTRSHVIEKQQSIELYHHAGIHVIETGAKVVFPAVLGSIPVPVL